MRRGHLHVTARRYRSTIGGSGLSRAADADDRRLVRLTLTSQGEDVLAALSHSHEEELRRLAALLPDPDFG